MLLRGDLVHCPQLGQLEILHDHLLVISDTGFLDLVAPADSAESVGILQDASSSPTIIPKGSFLLPTFCDLHLHAPQFLYQGTGLHLPLMEWLDAYAFQAEERMDGDSGLAERVYKRLAERLIENGTGTVLLFGTIRKETNLILAKAMMNAGLRAFVGKLSMDISTRPSYVEPSAKAALQATASFVDDCFALGSDLPPHRKLVEPVLTPRFVPTCSDELLTGLGKLSSARNLRVQSHMAEAHDQMKWVREERGEDDVAVFARNGLLTHRTIQAHCTFLDSPEDLVEHGTSVAHCPLSNAYFSAKPFRLREALDSGVKVGLGTDIAGGYSIDMMSCMRQAVAVSRMRQGENSLRPGSGDRMNLSIGWKEALYLATRGGAIALGLESGPGLFTVGAPFDAQCIQIFDPHLKIGIGPLDFFDTGTEEPRDIDKDCWRLSKEVVEKWWCLGDVRNRKGMWIQGLKIA